jgi:hypothetical protein
LYVNGKKTPVETSPGMGEEDIKKNGGGGEFKYDIFEIVITFVNVTMYPHPAQQLQNNTIQNKITKQT